MPIADGAIILGLAGGVAYVAERRVGYGETNGILAVGMIVLSIPYLYSTLYGLATTRRCRIYLAGPPYPYPPDQVR